MMSGTQMTLLVKLLLICVMVGTVHMATISNKTRELRFFEIATIPFVPKEYALSFDVKRTNSEDPWNNFIHFNTLAYSVEYKRQDRWFTWGIHPKRLHICSPNYGYRTFCYSMTWSSGANEWVNIRLTQEKYMEDYIFKIYVNGKEVHNVYNEEPSEYRDVKVHSGDGWYRPKAGYFTNFYFKFYCPRSLLGYKMELQRNTRLALLDDVSKEYHISFDIYQTDIQVGMARTLSFVSSKSTNTSSYTIAMPIVIQVPGKHTFYICTEKAVKQSRCFLSSNIFHLNHWVNIKVSQIAYGQIYIYKLVVNGKELFSSVIRRPRDLKNVIVQVGTPTDPTAKGLIRNLKLNGYCPMQQIISAKDAPGAQ